MASNCILCGADGLTPFGRLSKLPGVTSDCRKWNNCGTLVLCGTCGHLQKLTDEKWLADTSLLYSAYDLYSLSDGCEQVVFHEGISTPRSALVFERMLSEYNLADDGAMLDVGCGNGSAMISFSKLRPEWRLFGLERDDKYLSRIENIPGVEKCFVCEPGEIDSTFDLITIFHALEHVTDPVSFLTSLRRLLAPDGVLLIQAPYFIDNPFDLVVVDHCSHFTPATITRAVRKAGFEVKMLSSAWAKKEISLVAVPGSGELAEACDEPAENIPEDAKRRADWLDLVAADARKRACESDLGILGTSIAGTWLSTAVDMKNVFFVDEDTTRQGKSYMGKPVLSPAEVEPGSSVYLAFSPDQAREICNRLKNDFPTLPLIEPPAYPH